MMPVPNWQALLFVPVGAERHLASAIRLGPDAIILDLEDAIAPAEKARARLRVMSDQRAIAAAGIDCVVRVNAPLPDLVEDLRAIDPGGLVAIMVPKVEGTRGIRNVAELTEGKAGIIALIETPAALRDLHITADEQQVVGLMLGSEDYSAALGVDPDGGALVPVASQIAVAAQPRGLLPIGFPGSIANFRDLELLASQLAQGRNLGMQAAAAIHPAQLAVIRNTLKPTDAQVTWARGVVSALDRGANDAFSVIAIDGKMIDAPVIARARRILAQV